MWFCFQLKCKPLPGTEGVCMSCIGVSLVQRTAHAWWPFWMTSLFLFKIYFKMRSLVKFRMIILCIQKPSNQII